MKSGLQARVEGLAASLRGRLGCLVSDTAGTVWAAHRAGERFPAASIVKVPVLLALASRIDAGDYGWEHRVANVAEQDAGGGGVVRHLSALPYTLRDLATLMIIVSDNRATNAIIDLLGFHVINEYIAGQGWRDTVVARRMMDFVARDRGRENLTTASDTVDQFRRLLAGDLGSPATTAMLLDILRAQTERERLPAPLDREVSVANKTGTMRGTVNDAGILFLAGGPVVVAVLTDGLAANIDGMRAIQEISRAIAGAGGMSRP